MSKAYTLKSDPHTLPPVLGAYLKYEATPLTRVEVPAETGTKMGTFVNYALRGKKLLALSDEQDGKVVVQPHNCIINVSEISKEALQQAGGLDTLKQEGDTYGIVYQGTPQAA